MPALWDHSSSKTNSDNESLAFIIASWSYLLHIQKNNNWKEVAISGKHLWNKWEYLKIKECSYLTLGNHPQERSIQIAQYAKEKAITSF